MKRTFRNIRETLTECRRVDGRYSARLVIDHQSFRINYDGTKADVEWTRDQLAKALVRLMTGGKHPGKKNRRRVTFPLTKSGKSVSVRPT